MKINNNQNKSLDIIENAVVIYNDRTVDFFDAIYVNNNEVEFGKISDKNIFLKRGGISKNNIEKIIVFDEGGNNEILI